MSPTIRRPLDAPTTRLSLWLLVLAMFHAIPAFAHRSSDALLRVVLESGHLHGRLDLPLRDLVAVLPLDANTNGEITWGELRQQHETLRRWVGQRLTLTADGHPLACEPGELRVADLAGEPCASLPFHARPGAASHLVIDYRLFFDLDPQHRGLLRFERAGTVTTDVLAPHHSRVELDLAPGAAPAPTFGRFVREGTHHIWIGFDHVLFLLALLLPSVLHLEQRAWTPAPKFTPVARRVLEVVTAFTLAHSLTLALAALELVRLPSAPVETAIAASVAVAGLNNLIPFFRDRGWLVAGGFGLIHGFGFAGVLDDLSLPRGEFVRGLLGFNLGVEFGQLAIVAAFLPVAFLLRRGWFYRRLVLQGGSAVIVMIAAAWMAERALGLRFPGI